MYVGYFYMAHSFMHCLMRVDLTAGIFYFLYLYYFHTKFSDHRYDQMARNILSAKTNLADIQTLVLIAYMPIALLPYQSGYLCHY